MAMQPYDAFSWKSLSEIMLHLYIIFYKEQYSKYLGLKNLYGRVRKKLLFCFCLVFFSFLQKFLKIWIFMQPIDLKSKAKFYEV